MVEQPLWPDYQDRRSTGSDESGFEGFVLFFFGGGQGEGFDRFFFFFASSIITPRGGKSFLSFSFFFFFSICVIFDSRIVIDRADRLLVEIRGQIERFASHKQFRKSFSFMRFRNNWFTPPYAFMEIEFFARLKLSFKIYPLLIENLFLRFFLFFFY